LWAQAGLAAFLVAPHTVKTVVHRLSELFVRLVVAAEAPPALGVLLSQAPAILAAPGVLKAVLAAVAAVALRAIAATAVTAVRPLLLVTPP